MREIRTSGSEGGGTQINEPSLPLSVVASLRRRDRGQTAAHLNTT